MVLNYRPANYIGWPIPAFYMVQRYNFFLNYANILAIILLKMKSFLVKLTVMKNGA